MKRITKLWPWLAAICSGLLYAACFAPFNLTWFCWIALTPLIAAIWFSGAESRHRVASKPASRLCRRPDVLLDRILLAHDGHRSRLVCSCVLHGDLFRDLGVVLRFVASTSGQEAISWRKQMGPDARPSPNHRGSRAIAVDKIDKQPATRFHPRGGMDHA